MHTPRLSMPARPPHQDTVDGQGTRQRLSTAPAVGFMPTLTLTQNSMMTSSRPSLRYALPRVTERVTYFKDKFVGCTVLESIAQMWRMKAGLQPLDESKVGDNAHRSTHQPERAGHGYGRPCGLHGGGVQGVDSHRVSIVSRILTHAGVRSSLAEMHCTALNVDGLHAPFKGPLAGRDQCREGEALTAPCT